jgi:hypothetical protein
MNEQSATAAVHLFAPRAATLAGGASAATTSAGRNPPQGANVYVSLARTPDSAATVRLEFLDGAGRVVRRYTRAPAASPGASSPPRPTNAARTTVELKQGLNAVQWDLRADPPTALPGNINVWGGPVTGYRVAPGRYQVRLTVGSMVQTQSFDVRQDPRLAGRAAEIAARDSLARAINGRVGEVHDALLRLRDVKEQVSKLVERTKDHASAAPIAAAGKSLVTRIEALEPQLSTRAANGQDVINFRNGINAQFAFLLGNVEQNDVVTQASRERFAELERAWAALRGQADAVVQQEVPSFNKRLQDAQVGGVIVPAAKPAPIT